VTENYDLHDFPGWEGNTAGYHIDDGKIFDTKNPYFGRESDGKFPRFLLAIKQVQFKYVYYTHFMSVQVYEKSLKPVCFSVVRDNISELGSLVS
jgi:hypothetical protein